jgi:glutamate N-acetyltransferase/amino-acid N-acetyltransferase
MAGSPEVQAAGPGFEVQAEAAPVAGLSLGVARAAIRKPDREDLLLVQLAAGAASAAVFTRNAFRAAPVLVAEEHLRSGTPPRALLVNSGNANAGTGEAGLDAARRCARALAGLLDLDPRAVLPFSTGVIGEPLPVARIEAALPALVASATAGGVDWAAAARAIMTTDTRPKLRSVRIHPARPGDPPWVVTGIAKGAGMIRPDMATMLAYVATDAPVEPGLLRVLLQAAMARSFNRISVDGDTSTNDACVLMATGQGGGEPRRADDPPGYRNLAAGIDWVCAELARDIVRDGEGATKFIRLVITGGRDEAECLQVAYTIAHSPLVKTAFFASDANWGRILAAIGRAGLADLAIEGVTLALNGVPVVARGARHPAYTDAAGQAAMAAAEITVAVGLGRGTAATEVWTCDLGHEYVRINAEYRS